MAHSSSSASRTFTPPLAEFGIGIAAWSTFVLATCTYCLIHQAFVSVVTPDLERTVTVALREWGAWALLAPCAVFTFHRPATWHKTLFRCTWFSLLAASLPILFDHLTEQRTFGSSVALFWPRNFAMALALFFVARAFFTSAVKPATSARIPYPNAPAEKHTTLLVSKGADRCLIRLDDIQHLSAAGNYVDICARGQHYLMRATLNDLETKLPSEHFVRIHRSHIVRVSEIERIQIERSGSGVVHLRGGGTLAISKGYRAQLKQQQDAVKQTVH